MMSGEKSRKAIRERKLINISRDWSTDVSLSSERGAARAVY